MFFACIVFLSCKKDFSKNGPSVVYWDNSQAYLKIIDLSPNFSTITGGSDTFNILVNGKKINGSSLSFNGIFPYSISPTTNTYTSTYAAVPIGNNTIQLAMGINKPDSVIYATIHAAMSGGQRYSLLITDSILKGTNDSAKMFIRDDYADPSVIPDIPLNGYIILRFGNLVLNDTGKVDLWSYSRNTTLFSKIRPDSISQFGLTGYNYSAVDTFYVLRSLSTTSSLPLAQRQVLAKIAFNASVTGSNISPVGRAFTIVYKGDFSVTSGTKAPSILTYIQ